MFPRREDAACHWYCNEWLGYLSEGITRGMQAGRLRIPEGLPMLWNVYDYGGCSIGAVRRGRGLMCAWGHVGTCAVGTCPADLATCGCAAVFVCAWA